MIYKINRTLIAIIGLPLIFVTPISSIVFTLLSMLTFHIFGLIIHWLKNILFSIPVIAFSKLYEKYGIVGKIISIFGLPFSVVGNIIVTLISHGGDFQLRAYELKLFESFPYSYSFDKYAKNQLNLSDLEGDAQDVIVEMLEDQRFHAEISKFRSRYI